LSPDAFGKPIFTVGWSEPIASIASVASLFTMSWKFPVVAIVESRCSTSPRTLWTILFLSSKSLSRLARIRELMMLRLAASASASARARISLASRSAFSRASFRLCSVFSLASRIVSSALSLASERMRLRSLSSDSDISNLTPVVRALRPFEPRRSFFLRKPDDNPVLISRSPFLPPLLLSQLPREPL